jgi:hypothetical protein
MLSSSKSIISEGAGRDDLVVTPDAACRVDLVRRDGPLVGTMAACGAGWGGAWGVEPWKRPVANPTNDASRPADAEEDMDWASSGPDADAAEAACPCFDFGRLAIAYLTVHSRAF